MHDEGSELGDVVMDCSSLVEISQFMMKEELLAFGFEGSLEGALELLEGAGW